MGGASVSRVIVLIELITLPSLRSTTRIVYSPSGARRPSASRPFQMKRCLASPARRRSSTIRRTSRPSLSTIMKPTFAGSERSKPTSETSRKRSPLGEKWFGPAAKRMTSGKSPFSCWVTKKAPSVASRSRTNTARTEREPMARGSVVIRMAADARATRGPVGRRDAVRPCARGRARSRGGRRRARDLALSLRAGPGGRRLQRERGLLPARHRGRPRRAALTAPAEAPRARPGHAALPPARPRGGHPPLPVAARRTARPAAAAPGQAARADHAQRAAS